ncbi:unnamed protein product [Linum tenue]|uniref:Uncharacterized protein n=1 Tax=Linum tenue TaxID=586396 RepID=A0AAV0I3Z5_9ROSI|nr:unnamed protein product [Linum tenue]
MPTFSAIALDRLLEPGASKSVDKSTPQPKPPPPRPSLHRRNSTSITERSPHRPQLTPSLYTTPEATPVPPSSPTSYTSSPYIINHKRRGPRLSKSASVDNIASQRKALDKDEAEGSSKSAESQQINGHHEGAKARSNGKAGSTNLRHGILKDNDSSGARDSDIEDFFDPQESMSHASNTDSEDNVGSSAMQNSSVQMAEFFDAWEELSSESGIQSALHDFQSELGGTRLSLLMEIEKRRQAEDALKTVESQWQRIRQQLALAGLTVPRCPIDVAESDEPNSTTDPAEELCQQLDVVRFVSSSIGRGIARAEMEVEMEAQLEAKNFEIARLVDRLRYYEAVNREMSQRNQEAVEMARRNRQVQKRRQRWVWGSIAAAITLGTAALAWSYLPPRDGSAASTSSSSVEIEQPDSASSD